MDALVVEGDDAVDRVALDGEAGRREGGGQLGPVRMGGGAERHRAGEESEKGVGGGGGEASQPSVTGQPWS